MTADENKRVATLTTGAIKTTTDNAVKAMMDAVEAAEEKTREMRAAVEEYVKEFEQVTGVLADNVNTHVASCQAAIDSFQAHHLKILNVDAPVLAVPEVRDTPEPRARVIATAVDLDDQRSPVRDALTDDIRKLARTANIPQEGRR